jgi:tetratricopeptide (TPR) repeat protein
MTTDQMRIGPYRLLQVLGEGGMGVVYEAEQIEPVRRRVAVKLLRLGMDGSGSFTARFEAERQALAVMDHPNIARVFDAGTTEDGRPYYVMERVAGLPITDFCDEHKLTTSQRLDLFIDVCQAVQHAHQKGVIHRDLKPSNVLVAIQDDRPTPKIIDFGIAKALGSRLTDLTLVTVAGRPIGTPAYMSPEQWDPQFDIDTRTDIYSLGVMLYELLVGHLPFDPGALVRAGPAAAQVLRRTMPDPPSLRYRSLGENTDPVAAARRTDPRGLARELKGDLDWITLKAIDPDRAKRYETAHSLAGDIGRYLRSEPILARPPSGLYRFGRFIHRHRVGAAVTATLLAGGVTMAVVTAIQAREVARERDRATAEAAKARALNSFLQETLLSPDPISGVRREVTVVEALDSAAARLAREPIASEPVMASVESSIGWAYYKLGRYDKAEPLLAAALQLRERTPGPDSVDLAESLFRMGSLYQMRAVEDSAERAYRRAMAIRRRVPASADADLAQMLSQTASFLGARGDTAEAGASLREAHAIYDRLHDSSGIAMVENFQGILAHARGDLPAAERYFTSAVAIRRRTRDPALGDALGNLGVVYDDQGRAGEAERAYREAIADLTAKFGPEHDMVTAMSSNLAILLDRGGRSAEAESLYRHVLAIDEPKFGRDHPAVGRTLTNLSLLLCQRGKAESGLPLSERGLAIAKKHSGPNAWEFAATEAAVGVCLAALHRFPEAEATLLAALEGIERTLGPTHWRADSAKARLGRLYLAWGKPERAAAITARPAAPPDR